jgi:hypothetical protein
VYDGDINTLDDADNVKCMHTIKKNKSSSLVGSKETGLEVNVHVS